MTRVLIAAGSNVNVNISGLKNPSTSVLIIIVFTVLAIAPSVLVLMTAFPRVFIVLSLTRNALGTQTVPPNQVLAGLALILSLFIMAPVHLDHRSRGHPALRAREVDAPRQAIDAGEVPLKKWMLEQTKRPGARPLHLLQPPECQTSRIAAHDHGDPGLRALGDSRPPSSSGS